MPETKQDTAMQILRDRLQAIGNDKFNFLGHFGIGKNSKGVYCLLYSNEFCVNLFEDITFEYLHVLQRFYLDFKHEPLKITLK